MSSVCSTVVFLNFIRLEVSWFILTLQLLLPLFYFYPCLILTLLFLLPSYQSLLFFFILFHSKPLQPYLFTSALMFLPFLFPVSPVFYFLANDVSLIFPLSKPKLYPNLVEFS
uniref:Uncharacterized protein n=1 Tax=Cacopsylla melanoneura TaxID=428564 RepID=A0A8D9ADC0_9HEMI